MPRAVFVRCLLLALLVAPLAAVARPARGAAAESIYFPETGLTLSDEHGFLSYWRAHGGLAQFGYPRTPETREVNPANGRFYIVQWFERNRFEWHPENKGTPYEALLGLLGAQAVIGREGEGPFARVADPRSAGRTYFPETGHTLSNSFKAYWEAHGGLALYGYPLSEEFDERDPGSGQTYIVQYFERNRFEYHPENRGTDYEVLLGLLGNRIVGDPGTPDAPVASVATPLAVPAHLRNGPFATARALTLPLGFAANVFAAGLPGARLLAFAPNGDLFLSRKDAGEIVVLPDGDRDGTSDDTRLFAGGLAKPHGLAFGDGYLYVAQEASVIRFPYSPGDRAARGPAETIVPDLPSGPGVGLAGGVNHDTRSLAFGADGKLYVSVGSDCDLCTEADARRATILQFNPDGSGGRIFASGLRNAVGLGVDPRTNLLWATGNERNGLGPDRPNDFFAPLRDGVNYGWPSCVGSPPAPDPTLGAGKDEFCRTAVETPPTLLPPHSAPLGFAFSEGARLPAPFANGVFIAEHGPFDRPYRDGHRLVFVSLVPGRQAAGPRDFATGWLNADGTLWGNPVAIVVGPDGALYVSDDLAGAVYRITHTGR
jgi:glucose/arabinose dehydrogenase